MNGYKTLVIAGYSGIGKTTFIEHWHDVLDYDDTRFPKEPRETVRYIKAVRGKVRYITLLTDIELLQCLVENGIEFHVVIPDINRMDEFMKMYHRRDIETLHLANAQADANVRIRRKRWSDELEAITDFCVANDIDLRILRKGEFFSDAVYEIEGDLLSDHSELNEKRHVAAYQFIGAVDDITKWLKKMSETDYQLYPEKDEYVYVVPRELSRKLMIFSDIDITVHVYNLNVCDMSEMGGNIMLNDSEFLDDSQQRFGNGVSVAMNAQIENGEFYQDTFMTTMVHELNHKYEQLQRMRHGEQAIGRLYNQVAFERKLFSLGNGHFKCSAFDEELILNVIYLLFIETEFHAEAASVFGDLFSFDGKVLKYKLDAYHRYAWISANLGRLKGLSDETFSEIFALLRDQLKIFEDCRRVETFRRRFINEVSKRLDMFYQKIESIYNFYYEFKAEHDRMKTKDEINEGFLIHYTTRFGRSRHKRDND